MKNAYLTPDEWMRVLGSDNLQPQIYVRESDEIQRKPFAEIQSGRMEGHDYLAS